MLDFDSKYIIYSIILCASLSFFTTHIAARPHQQHLSSFSVDGRDNGEIYGFESENKLPPHAYYDQYISTHTPYQFLYRYRKLPLMFLSQVFFVKDDHLFGKKHPILHVSAVELWPKENKILSLENEINERLIDKKTALLIYSKNNKIYNATKASYEILASSIKNFDVIQELFKQYVHHSSYNQKKKQKNKEKKKIKKTLPEQTSPSETSEQCATLTENESTLSSQTNSSTPELNQASSSTDHAHLSPSTVASTSKMTLESDDDYYVDPSLYRLHFHVESVLARQWLNEQNPKAYRILKNLACSADTDETVQTFINLESESQQIKNNKSTFNSKTPAHEEEHNPNNDTCSENREQFETNKKIVTDDEEEETTDNEDEDEDEDTTDAEKEKNKQEEMLISMLKRWQPSIEMVLEDIQQRASIGDVEAQRLWDTLHKPFFQYKKTPIHNQSWMDGFLAPAKIVTTLSWYALQEIYFFVTKPFRKSLLQNFEESPNNETILSRLLRINKKYTTIKNGISHMDTDYTCSSCIHAMRVHQKIILTELSDASDWYDADATQ